MRTIVKLALWHAIPAVAASLIMSTSHAQASFGVRGGANRAKMTAKDGMLGDVSNRSGFEAGIAFGLPIAQWITLAPELGYVQRGYHREATYLNAAIPSRPCPVMSRWMSWVPS
jgi:hypothetical protein